MYYDSEILKEIYLSSLLLIDMNTYDPPTIVHLRAWKKKKG